MNAPEPMEPTMLLPWYVNGTLTDSERRSVEQWLGRSEEGQAELLLWRAVRLDSRSRSLAESGAELGWRRLRTQLAAVPSAPSRSVARPWRWAAAASVVAILALQTALLLRNPVEDIHRPLSVPATTDVWRVQLRLVESATVSELNALLQRHDASISEGPSALGLYTVSVPRAQYPSVDALLADWSAEPLVLQVSVAP